jgi:hypothetical protein
MTLPSYFVLTPYAAAIGRAFDSALNAVPFETALAYSQVFDRGVVSCTYL